MRNGTLIGLAAALAACGAASTVTNNTVEAQQLRTKQKQGQAPRRQPRSDPLQRERELNGFQESGGMAGCFDPRLRGYPRAAAERIGGRPCGEAPDRRTARPEQPSGPTGASWIIGEWGPGGSMCSLNGPTLEAGGVYYYSDERGRWSLAGNTLTLVVTHVSDDGGDSEYPLRQPRRMTVRVSPLPEGRMRWQPDDGPERIFRRCRSVQFGASSAGSALSERGQG
jgi:hypothetical protein